MSAQLNEIQQVLQQASSPEAREAHKKFVPGKDRIYGVRMPVLNKLSAEYKTGGFDLSSELWKAGALEEKILAIKILERIAGKDPERALKMVKHFAGSIGNWAVCDALGMQALKKIVKTHPDEIFALAEKYNQSPDLWQRRLSLVLVEWYTRMKPMHPRIKKLVKNLEDDEEYYVKKAFVWINKNFAKGK